MNTSLFSAIFLGANQVFVEQFPTFISFFIQSGWKVLSTASKADDRPLLIVSSIFSKHLLVFAQPVARMIALDWLCTSVLVRNDLLPRASIHANAMITSTSMAQATIVHIGSAS